jgi:hypothetical protein
MARHAYHYFHGQITLMPPAGPVSAAVPLAMWLLCPHLQPVAESILQHGGIILGVSTAWTRMLLAVILDRGPTLAAAHRLVVTIPQVAVWENHDSHYAIEYGVRCSDCHHALSWPQAASYDDG